jgi:hypothetical protein
VLVSTSSVVAPGLSHTCSTGGPRKFSSSKKYWRKRCTTPIGESSASRPEPVASAIGLMRSSASFSESAGAVVRSSALALAGKSPAG